MRCGHYRYHLFQTTLAKMNSTERSRKCRAKIKTDSIKHEQIKLKDRMRKKQSRNEERKKLLQDPDKLEIVREKKREEMKKYRQRKREEKNEQSSSKRSIAGKDTQKKKKSLAEKRKELDRKKKAYERAKLEKAQKANAVKRTQMWRLRINLQEKINENQDDLNQNETPFTSPSSQYRAVQKVKTTLPKTPKKRAAVIETLTKSPSCKSILEDHGVIVTKVSRNCAQVGKNLLNTIQKMAIETKQKKGISKAHRYARKTLTKLVTDTPQSKGMKNLIAKYTGIRKKKLNATHWNRFEKRRRKDGLTAETKSKVVKFFTSGEVSRCLPNKKDASKKKNEPKFVMTVTIKEAYVMFKKEYPDAKVGLISFYKLKPKNVKKIAETNRRCCLCVTCCNVALKVEAANKFTTACPEIKNITKRIAANMTLCSYEGEFPNEDCLNQTCKKCGPSKIKEYYEGLIEEFGEKEIEYHRWERIKLLRKNNKMKDCMSCIQKKKTFKQFLVNFQKDVKPLASHLFRASWQLKQLETCKETIKENEMVVVMDFSENYTCRFQNEVQSAFWNSNQVTIHPVVAYYGVKTATSTIQRKHSIVIVSNDLDHDANAVNKFREEIYKKLEDEVPKLSLIHEWTDGCANQYKGKVGFADVSNDDKRVQRHFFETSHGKNVCDGVGATLKNVCHHAVISNKHVIGDANSMYEFAKERLTVNTVETKREFLYVAADTITRNRPEVAEAETLVGTRKLHSVKNCNSNLELYSRNLSCFCKGCTESGLCKNSKYVDEWEKKNLKVKGNKCIL